MTVRIPIVGLGVRHLAPVVMLVASMLASAASASVTPYPKPDYAAASRVFALKANGRPVDVVHFTDYHYAHFSFDGPALLAVTVNEPIESHDISPHSLRIAGRTEGRTLSFTIRPAVLTPNYLVVQINDLEKLVILADPPETDIPPAAGPDIYNVAAPPYRADSTGSVDATSALQRAIDDAGRAGGGVVYVPPGVYKVTKTLLITGDNVDLYLAGGAVIKASENRGDYEGDDYTRHVIRVRNASNVTIRGRGTIDASGFSLFDKALNEETRKYEGRRGVIRADGCTNYTVEGVTVKDGTTWVSTVYTSEHVLVRNVKVLNYKDVGGYKIQNDGIDICASRHVRVDKCFVMTIDDPLCVKATDENQPMYDVLMTNNVLFTSCAGQKSGMQAHSEMRDIWFANNDVLQCRRGIVVEATTGSALMSDIHYLDIRVEKQIPSSAGSERNVDFIARTASQSDVEISRVIFEERHESRFDITRPNSVSKVSINETFAGNDKIESAGQFKRTGDGELGGLAFDAGETVSVLQFTDVQSHPHRQDIEALALRGVVTGVYGSRFAPDDLLTRADWIVLLMRVLRLEGNSTEPFTDVRPSDYFSRAVSCARSLGIIEGDAASFRPRDPVTRRDMMLFASNALRSAGLTAEGLDSLTVSEGVTRAEGAVVAHRVLRQRLVHQVGSMSAK